MKMTKTWTLTAVSAAVFGAALTGCNAAPSQTGNSGNARVAQKTLIMATSADYKPYEYHDTSTGKDQIIGFDVDIAKEIAKELHFKLQIQDMTFDGLIGELQAKRADFVIAGMTPTPARAKNVDFSKVYYTARNVILAKKSNHLKNAAQLKGKTVGVQLGSTQEDAAKGIKGAKVQTYDTIPMIVEQVETNRINAAIIENTVAKGWLKTYPDLSAGVMPTSKDAGSAIAFPKGSPWVKKFNHVLTHMKKDGQMDKLIIKWFGGAKTK